MKPFHLASAEPSNLPDPQFFRRQQHQTLSALQARLLGLSFHGFEQCLRQLLEAMGYTDVTLPGRTYRRQRTGHGGLDVTAWATIGVTRERIIMQLKQYRRPVHRRFVDELRGTMLRVEARQGLLITTSTFARAAYRAAREDHIAPIRLIDGDELLALLVMHQIGVRQREDGSWTLDTAFFEQLHQHYPHSSRKGLQANQETTKSAGSTAMSLFDEGYHSQQSVKGGRMQWRTHVLAGISALWLLEPIPAGITPDNLGFLLILASFGALLPDLDADEAKIKSLRLGGVQPFVPLANLTHRTLGHRGMLHSLTGLGLVALLALPIWVWWAWQPYLALLLGYASHLAMDASTRSGIPLFFPRAARVHLLPRRLRFVTGSLAEQMLFPFLVGAVLLLLLKVAEALLHTTIHGNTWA